MHTANDFDLATNAVRAATKRMNEALTALDEQNRFTLQLMRDLIAYRVATTSALAALERNDPDAAKRAIFDGFAAVADNHSPANNERARLEADEARSLREARLRAGSDTP
jgi:hypothetical protein